MPGRPGPDGSRGPQGPIGPQGEKGTEGFPGDAVSFLTLIFIAWGEGGGGKGNIWIPKVIFYLKSEA